jgi:transcriptional regulator with XRE-family HTH domain
MRSPAFVRSYSLVLMATSEHVTTAGEVVRAKREELGLTKAELARRAHLTRSSIHEIESGQRTHLQARTLHALDLALGLDPGTLERVNRPSVFVSHSVEDALLGASFRRELEERLGERRYESVLELLMRVADRVDELESRLRREAS